ncbi:MAG: response regulator [Candidatus Omnitrophica bacterium]|nr:response regulator [Candidatus Omnitrophota bacterium]
MEHIPKKEVYSPYDISKICQVALSDVLQWIEQARLSFFVVPGGHKRIRHCHLEKFLTENHYPVPQNWNETFEKFRVLVVEDDQDLLEIVAELLHEESRLEVRTEDHGFSAGLQIASWHPDLILLDFLMPGMTGFEVCKRLRKNSEIQDIPVLAVTSLATVENKRAVMESGVSDFLGKPFHSEELLNKVRILLGMSTNGVYQPESGSSHSRNPQSSS